MNLKEQNTKLTTALYSTAKTIQIVLNLISDLNECETYADIVLYCRKTGVEMPDTSSACEARDIIQCGLLVSLEKITTQILDKFPAEPDESYKWN